METRALPNLERALAIREWTASDLARATEIGRQYATDLVRGEKQSPGRKIQQRIAAAVGLEIHELENWHLTELELHTAMSVFALHAAARAGLQTPAKFVALAHRPEGPISKDDWLLFARRAALLSGTDPSRQSSTQRQRRKASS